MEVNKGNVYRYRELGIYGRKEIVKVDKVEKGNVWFSNQLLKIRASCTVEDFKERAEELK